MSYRLIDHTADLGIEVRSPNGPQLFVQSALAMGDLIFESTSGSKIRHTRIQVAGEDWPDLMVNWLRELLYFWNGPERMVKTIAILDFNPYDITAEIGWEKYHPHQHSIRNEIKAATYHQIAAGPLEDETQGWRARVIFDL